MKIKVMLVVNHISRQGLHYDRLNTQHTEFLKGGEQKIYSQSAITPADSDVVITVIGNDLQAVDIIMDKALRTLEELQVNHSFWISKELNKALSNGNHYITILFDEVPDEEGEEEPAYYTMLFKASSVDKLLK